MKKALHITAKVLFNIAVVLLGVYFIVSTLVSDAQIEGLLTDYVFKDKPADEIISTGREPIRYKTWYSSVEDNLNGSGEVAWYAQAEGTVLLQNDDSALPLDRGDKVSLFGVTAYDPMYCLDGAGNNKINDPQAYGKSVNTEINRRQFFYDEFANVGLDMNSTLRDWYNGSAGLTYRRRDTIGFWGSEGQNSEMPAVTEAPWSTVNGIRDAGAYNRDTTAVYITGRMTNEGNDTPNINSNNSGSVLTRSGGVANQAAVDDYLALTDIELELINNLKSAYSKLIVIFNQASTPQSDLPEVLKSTDTCDVAALWIGFPGSDGIKAVADILVGKINPSGGLTAGWYARQDYNPSMRTYSTTANGNVAYMEGMYVGYRYAETKYEDTLNGITDYDYDAYVSYPFGFGLSYATFEYSNVNVIADPNPEKNKYSGGLMAYNNGLYMAANGGTIEQGYTGNYGKQREVLRATGDNLGDNDDLIVEVTVTNTSDTYSGKEIVQIYLQQPITDTDRAHKVEKPSVQLIGYAKTDVIAPGDHETVQIKIDANKWFAAYDALINGGAQFTGGGYVLAAGDYLLVAARNAHEAVNSIYRYKNPSGDMTKLDIDYGAGKASNVFAVEVSQERSESYKYWTQGGGYTYYENDEEHVVADVRNLFADLDPNMDGTDNNDLLYFSRYNWSGTTATTDRNSSKGITFKMIGATSATTGYQGNDTDAFNSNAALTPERIDAYEAYYKVKFDSTPYTYGWSNTEWQLSDMIGIEFDPVKGASEDDMRKWAEIVGQLHINDNNSGDNVFSNGRRQTVAIKSIGKPTTADENASNGFEWLYGRIDGAESNVGFYKKFDNAAARAYPTGYPCEGIIAATYNNNVALLVGQSIGEDALWSGVSGIYGFGLGLQRNPYHGRTGEYYGDDPFLTGMMAGYETLGAQQKGLYVYNKHFVLNDQETARTTFKAWLSEQTLRQMYLRPFEMAIEIGDAMNVMIAFNKNGNNWGGSNYNLMTRWLRGEAAMSGFAISDWYNNGQSIETLSYGILAGSDLMDGPVTIGSSFWPDCDDRFKHRVVESATHILYTVANSNAMNFIGDGTTIYTYDAQWIYYRDVLLSRLEPALIVTFAVCYAFLIGMTVWNIIDNRKKAVEQPDNNPLKDGDNVDGGDGER